jgi:hypothetical protein
LIVSPGLQDAQFKLLELGVVYIVVLGLDIKTRMGITVSWTSSVTSSAMLFELIFPSKDEKDEDILLALGNRERESFLIDSMVLDTRSFLGILSG